ncbi:MAG TPA: hypothetical protein VD994_14140 [Prosthecobacter sp.]|nr:hypothetical protein [Prosthecobacter sp.]
MAQNKNKNRGHAFPEKKVPRKAFQIHTPQTTPVVMEMLGMRDRPLEMVAQDGFEPFRDFVAGNFLIIDECPSKIALNEAMKRDAHAPQNASLKPLPKILPP